MYLIGLDIGKLNDPTAMAVLAKGADGRYTVAGLGRVPLGWSYVDTAKSVAKRVAEVNAHAAHSGDTVTLVVDGTGVGVAVVDQLRDAVSGCAVVSITFSGGATHTLYDDGSGPVVPKIDLVTTSVVLAEQGRLLIPEQLEEGSTLATELGNIEREVTASGREHFTHRSGTHDDLALAVCCAAWWGENLPVPPEEWVADSSSGAFANWRRGDRDGWSETARFY